MHNTAVGLAGPFAHIQFPLQHQNAALRPRQLPCDGASRHAGADDQNINHLVPSFELFLPILLYVGK